jgi:hypothetical protein
VCGWAGRRAVIGAAVAFGAGGGGTGWHPRAAQQRRCMLKPCRWQPMVGVTSIASGSGRGAGAARPMVGNSQVRWAGNLLMQPHPRLPQQCPPLPHRTPTKVHTAAELPPAGSRKVGCVVGHIDRTTRNPPHTHTPPAAPLDAGRMFGRGRRLGRKGALLGLKRIAPVWDALPLTNCKSTMALVPAAAPALPRPVPAPLTIDVCRSARCSPCPPSDACSDCTGAVGGLSPGYPASGPSPVGGAPPSTPLLLPLLPALPALVDRFRMFVASGMRREGARARAVAASGPYLHLPCYSHTALIAGWRAQLVGWAVTAGRCLSLADVTIAAAVQLFDRMAQAMRVGSRYGSVRARVRALAAGAVGTAERQLEPSLPPPVRPFTAFFAFFHRAPLGPCRPLPSQPAHVFLYMLPDA